MGLAIMTLGRWGGDRTRLQILIGDHCTTVVSMYTWGDCLIFSPNQCMAAIDGQLWSFEMIVKPFVDRTSRVRFDGMQKNANVFCWL